MQKRKVIKDLTSDEECSSSPDILHLIYNKLSNSTFQLGHSEIEAQQRCTVSELYKSYCLPLIVKSNFNLGLIVKKNCKIISFNFRFLVPVRLGVTNP